MLDEFSLIKKFFTPRSYHHANVILGVGDDGALIKPNPHQLLVCSTDTLVEGVHFFKKISPEILGRYALAVNLSDLAAMGARPAYVLLSLMLPNISEKWLKSFSRGFFKLAHRYSIDLVGGNMAEGPLSMTAQVIGLVKAKEALRRDRARPGDYIYVSGKLGGASAAWTLLKKQKKLSAKIKQKLFKKLYSVTPRIELGLKLCKIARAAIDISDGLCADLSHILKQSHVGATIALDAIPISNFAIQKIGKTKAKMLALTGGGDYELCFTVSPQQHGRFKTFLKEQHCTCIGRIEERKGLRVLSEKGSLLKLPKIKGYQHF